MDAAAMSLELHERGNHVVPAGGPGRRGEGAARMRLRPRPGQPRAVFAAVRLMYFGALAELGPLLTIIATAASVRAAVTRSHPASVPTTVLHIIADAVLA